MEEGFKKVFADWKSLNENAKLDKLLQRESVIVPGPEAPASHSTLDWAGTQFYYCDEVVHYIEERVYASDDDKQW